MIEPGTLIDGRYEVLERVGSGGMADVYLASDQLLGRKVAVKVLHHRFAEDQEFVERFRREASSAAGLSHPNVVSIFDRGEWDGTYYIAMEYLPGRTLKAIVRQRGALEPAVAIDVVVQILRAARFAHRRGVIHRDIKPHNVILDEEGRAKVTDFGIARAGASDMTLTGSIMGTAQYLSPEQAQGHAVSESSDLYAIGVVLYELLAGKVPFEGETAVTIALQHISQEPPPPSSVNPAVPPELDAVVLQALRKDPAQRYQSADELIAALEQVRATLPAPRDEHALSGAGAAAGLAGAGLARDLAQPGLSTLRHTRPAPGAPGAPGSPGSPGAGTTGSWRPATGQLAAYSSVGAAGHSGASAGAGGASNGDHRAPPQQRDRRRWWWIGAAALIALAAVAVLLVLLLPRTVTVPKLEGLTKQQAIAKLRHLGLKADPSSAYSTSIEKGYVVTQSPPAGADVKPHATVGITVSLGAGSTRVPELAGLSLEAAEESLNRLGLHPEPVHRHSETVKPGFVISAHPPAGQVVQKNSTVVLYVSMGPAKVKVPRVIGETQASAEEILKEAGLAVTVTESPHAGASAGTVFAQDPHAGTLVDKGTGVTIEVAKAKGPAKVVVPSVIEDGRESALATLRAAGFSPEVIEEPVTNPSHVGFVVKQEPPAGSKESKGSTVKIYVGVESSTTSSSTTSSTTSTNTSSSTTTTKSTQAGG
jgi:beta-lactam-binding protein with PASTA domain